MCDQLGFGYNQALLPQFQTAQTMFLEIASAHIVTSLIYTPYFFQILFLKSGGKTHKQFFLKFSIQKNIFYIQLM